MSSKPMSVRQAKGAARNGDRHRPTLVEGQGQAGIWARELSTLRIADLFRTAAGLPGHWAQIQAQVNAGNHHFFQTTTFGGGYNDGGKTSDQGKEIISWLADAIVNAARAASFDFAMLQLRFTPDTAWLKVARINGRLQITSTPGYQNS